jgi:hypothetical protein
MYVRSKTGSSKTVYLFSGNVRISGRMEEKKEIVKMEGKQSCLMTVRNMNIKLLENI